MIVFYAFSKKRVTEMKDYNEKVKEKKQKATDKPSASSSMAGDATLNGPGPGPGMRWMEQICIHVGGM